MIQDQIKQAMSAEADRLLPPDHLAETAITRGRRVRRTRRVGLGVAIVSGIVAAAVLPGTLLTSGRQDPAVTPTPSPEKRHPDPPYSSLPQGAPPRLPYTVGRAKDGGYLHDGDTQVRIARGLRISVMSRVDGGWLVSRTDAQNKTVLGIKRPSGTFTAMAASAVGLAAVSPDGKRVAFPLRERNGKLRLAVFDVATGRRTDTTPITTRETELLGWNDNGIWYLEPGKDVKTNRTLLWQPGNSPRVVPSAGYLVVEQHPTRMIRFPSQKCVEVVTLKSGDRLQTLRRFCGEGMTNGDIATLSPDGRVVVLSDGTARPVDGGKVVKVRRSIMMPPEHLPWEDDTNVVLYDDEAMRSGGFTTARVRCDVRSGRCERLTSQKDLDQHRYDSIAIR